jgi:phosphoglycerate dehydrogenase-like enzyme
MFQKTRRVEAGREEFDYWGKLSSVREINVTAVRVGVIGYGSIGHGTHIPAFVQMCATCAGRFRW